MRCHGGIATNGRRRTLQALPDLRHSVHTPSHLHLFLVPFVGLLLVLLPLLHLLLDARGHCGLELLQLLALDEPSKYYLGRYPQGVLT